MNEVIRPAVVSDAVGLARVHIESWHTTYKGIVPDDYLANLSLESRVQNWQRYLGEFADGNYTYVAEQEARLFVYPGNYVIKDKQTTGEELFCVNFINCDSSAC